jgi:hypothetical protein
MLTTLRIKLRACLRVLCGQGVIYKVHVYGGFGMPPESDVFIADSTFDSMKK